MTVEKKTVSPSYHVLDTEMITNCKKYLVDKVRINLRCHISEHQLRSFQIGQWESLLSDGFVYELKGYLIGKRHERETTFSIPSSWWQQFEKEVFPKWLIQYFPVKEIEHKVKCEVVNICPHLPIPTDRNEEHISFLMRNDMLTDGKEVSQ